MSKQYTNLADGLNDVGGVSGGGVTSDYLIYHDIEAGADVYSLCFVAYSRELGHKVTIPGPQFASIDAMIASYPELAEVPCWTCIDTRQDAAEGVQTR